MATVPTEPQRPLHPRLLTAADLAAMPSELPSGPVKYELDEGRLVLMAPAGETLTAKGVIPGFKVSVAEFFGE